MEKNTSTGEVMIRIEPYTSKKCSACETWGEWRIQTKPEGMITGELVFCGECAARLRDKLTDVRGEGFCPASVWHRAPCTCGKHEEGSE